MSSISPLVSKFIYNTNLDRYLVLYTLNDSNSKLVIDALRDSSKSIKVLFGTSGNIQLIKNGTITDTIKNPIINLPDDVIGSDEQYINSNRSTFDPNQNVFFSYPDGRWIINISDSLVKILYNPVPRPEFIDYFNKNEGNALQTLYTVCSESGLIGLESGLIGLGSGNSNPICMCLNQTSDTSGKTEYCMENLLGSPSLQQEVRKQFAGQYGQLASVCYCSNPNCYARPNPFMDAYKIKHPCPTSLQIQICNTSIDATGNNSSVTTGNLSISQNCKNSLSTSTSTSTNTSTSTTTGGNGGNGGNEGSSSGGTTTTNVGNGGTATNTTQFSIGMFILFGILGLVFIGLIFKVIFS